MHQIVRNVATTALCDAKGGRRVVAVIRYDASFEVLVGQF